MLTFNFDNLPKGITISGGLKLDRVIATAIKLRLL